ncbi:TPA: O-antigen translocase [Photobacterium damselae]
MKRLLSVTGFSALLTLLRMFTGFIIAKVIAIYAGPSGMAMLGQFQSAISMLNGITNAPVSSALVRYTSENIGDGFDKCIPWWRASIQWVGLILVIIIPIGYIFSQTISFWLFDSENYYWLIIVSCSVLPFATMNTLIISVINGQQKYKLFVILGMISNIISTIFMVLLIYHYHKEGALIAAAINSAVTGLIIIIISFREPWFKLKYWFGKTDLECRKKVGSYILMAITSALTVPTSMILVRNILVSDLGWNATGQWQAVWKISEVYLSIITISLSTYYLPKLSSLKNKNEIVKEIKKTAIVIMPIVIILAGGIYLLRDLAISLLFTEEFKEARNLFFYQLCGDVVKILAWLYAYPMLSRGASHWYIFSEVFFSISLVLLTWLLVPIYNIEGANIAYLVNYILYFGFVYINVSKFSK